MLFGKGGLFVQKLKSPYDNREYAAGYMLPGVVLNETRKLAEDWSVELEISNIWEAALDQGLVSDDYVYDLLSSETNLKEASIIGSRAGYSYRPPMIIAEAVKKIFDKKVEAYVEEQAARGRTIDPENVLPVENLGEAGDAAAVGVAALVVPPVIKKLIERKTATLEELLKRRGTDSKAAYAWDDLDAEAQRRVRTATDVVSAGLEAWKPGDRKKLSHRLNIVDFMSDNLAGTYDPDTAEVRLAHARIQKGRAETIATMIHEVAHEFGVDMTLDHREATEMIAGHAIDRLLTELGR
jgi:hypothetical protein